MDDWLHDSYHTKDPCSQHQQLKVLSGQVTCSCHVSVCLSGLELLELRRLGTFYVFIDLVISRSILGYYLVKIK